MEFISNKGELFLKNSNSCLILLNFPNIKKKDYQNLKRKIYDNQEIFLLNNDELCSHTISLEHFQTYPKYNPKTKRLEDNLQETVFELQFKFFSRKLFCRNVLASKKKQLKTIFNCDKRHDRFEINHVLYSIKRYEDKAFGLLEKEKIKLTSFYHPLKDKQIVISIPIMCFDVETCVFNNNKDKHQPYMMHCKFSTNNLYFDNIVEERLLKCYNINQDSSIGEQFCEYVLEICNKY